MTAHPQEQLTPGDHQYFEWSKAKQQTNLLHPLMTHVQRRNYYSHYEDNQFKQNKTMITSPNSHLKKKQKINGIESTDQINHLQVKIFVSKNERDIYLFL